MLEQVARFAIEFEQSQVQLHGEIWKQTQIDPFIMPPLFSTKRSSECLGCKAQRRPVQHKEVQHWPAVVKNRSSGLKNITHDISQLVIKKKQRVVASSHVVQCIYDIFCSYYLVHCVSISTHSLVVERHHLAAYVPKGLGAVIGWVHSCPFGVNPAHLPLIVSEKDGSGSTVS